MNKTAKNSDNLSQAYFIVFLILFSLMSRLIPHPVNFAAMTGISLLSARYILRTDLKYLVPLICFFIADFFLGFHATMFFTYLGQVLVIALASLLPIQSEKKSVFIPSMVGSALMGSTVFFVLSNLGVFFEGMLYPMTWEGFVACYLMAVPFFKNQILGDLIFTGAGLALCETVMALAKRKASVRASSFDFEV